MTYIHVIHENAAWLEPLAEALDRQALPWRDWFFDRGVFDLSRPPPEGVFYNRMSASSHTRDHRYAAELTAAVLAWLERHGRRVINGSRALDLEISKARQYAALEASGLRTPATVLVAGKDLLMAAAQQHFAAGAFILKPNRGGKGFGVRLFHTVDALSSYIAGLDYEPPVDGLHVLQEYVRAQVPLITRAEFIGGRFIYAVEVDTSDGFELCPADACAVGDAACPATKEISREIYHHRQNRRRSDAPLRGVSYLLTTSASPGSSSLPTVPAPSIPMTSTPIQTTTATPRPAPAGLPWQRSPVIWERSSSAYLAAGMPLIDPANVQSAAAFAGSGQLTPVPPRPQYPYGFFARYCW